MKLIIDIPEDIYEDIIKNGFIYDKDNEVVTYALKNGIPLPKGHGRLIDANKLLKQPLDTANYPSNYVRIAETIIEADKEYEAEVITRGNCMLCGKELTKGLFFCKECGDKANSGK